MKKRNILIVTVLLLTLCGCSRFVADSYTVVTPYNAESGASTDTEFLRVDSKATLESAIDILVQNGTEHGTLRAYQYDGDLEADLSELIYDRNRTDPAACYAVDYMTYDCSLLISYYEIHVDISFRDILTPISEIEYVAGKSEAALYLDGAISNYEDHLTMFAAFSQEPDYQQIAEQYCMEHLADHAVWPEVSLNQYPSEGSPRIDEVLLDYGEKQKTLLQMDEDMKECLTAAGIYVRYSATEHDKANLLYSYLADRFHYQTGENSRPVYSVLCEGIVNDKALAWTWELLCKQADIECVTVEGSYNGEVHFWNIMTLDGVKYHTDLLEPLLSGTDMMLWYDDYMTRDYSWSKELYPSCPAPEVAEEPAEETVIPEPEAVQEKEETP